MWEKCGGKSTTPVVGRTLVHVNYSLGVCDESFFTLCDETSAVMIKSAGEVENRIMVL